MTPVERTLAVIAQRYGVALDGSLPIRLGASREDLPALCRAAGFTTGAEVGVWKGAYSKRFCAVGLRWMAVDPWAPYAEYHENKNDTELVAQAYAKAIAQLTPYGCTFVRKHSLSAAAEVPDGSLDVVYLDGNHEAPFVLDDLFAWTPKIRPGGILAGHDYRVRPEKPFIQVKAVVDEYTRARGIAPWFIFVGDRTPSFLWVIR